MTALSTYLGTVLVGQIHCGTAVELTTVLRSSDLRGFSECSDRVPYNRMIKRYVDFFTATSATPTLVTLIRGPAADSSPDAKNAA
jgi:hypothetical protein